MGEYLSDQTYTGVVLCFKYFDLQGLDYQYLILVERLMAEQTLFKFKPVGLLFSEVFQILKLENRLMATAKRHTFLSSTGYFGSPRSFVRIVSSTLSGWFLSVLNSQSGSRAWSL